MEKDKLLEILKEILGTCEDAYSCCPELEKLIIKIENNA